MRWKRLGLFGGTLGACLIFLVGCPNATTEPTPKPTNTVQSGGNTVSQTTLPDAFRTYQDVFNSVGTYLAQHSKVPVWIPSPNGMFSDPNDWMDVQFDTNDGYSLTVSGGSKLPANSPKIIGGNANILFDMMALNKDKPIPHFYWDNTSAVIPHGKTQSIELGHGVKGTMYTGTLDGQEDRNIVWKENGWTFGLETQTMQTVSFTVGQAKQLVSEYTTLKLPIKSGKCLIGVGSGAPSQAEFVIGNTRYIVYTGGWRVMKVVSAMTHVS